LHPTWEDRLTLPEEEWCLTMRGDNINCHEFVEFLGRYHDGELPAAQCRLLEAHLAQCQKCREYLEAYRATIRLARAAMEDLDEQAVPEELVKAILLSARSQRK
jgi:anti-sigma factor RsiW